MSSMSHRLICWSSWFRHGNVLLPANVTLAIPLRFLTTSILPLKSALPRIRLYTEAPLQPTAHTQMPRICLNSKETLTLLSILRKSVPSLRDCLHLGRSDYRYHLEYRHFHVVQFPKSICADRIYFIGRLSLNLLLCYILVEGPRCWGWLQLDPGHALRGFRDRCVIDEHSCPGMSLLLIFTTKYDRKSKLSQDDVGQTFDGHGRRVHISRLLRPEKSAIEKRMFSFSFKKLYHLTRILCRTLRIFGTRKRYDFPLWYIATLLVDVGRQPGSFNLVMRMHHLQSPSINIASTGSFMHITVRDRHIKGEYFALSK